MRYLLALLCILALAGVLAKPVCADVVSDFNDGTMQGWVPVDETSVSVSTSGGNPGGYFKMNDTNSILEGYVIAPTQFLGDWHSYASVSLDLRKLSGTTAKASNAIIMLTGPGGSYYKNFGKAPTTSWATYKVTLDSTQWTKSSGTWDALISNVTEFAILLDFLKGTESNGLDNVRLVSKPASTTMDISSAKQLPDGSSVQIAGVVSRLVDGGFYIQSDNGAAGIWVNTPLAVNESDELTISGTLSTWYSERLINKAVIVASKPGIAPVPVYVAPGDFGGVGLTAYDPTLGASPTPKETGLLVTTSGVITKTDDKGDFRVTDGSSVDGRCGPGVAAPIPGSVATLIGVSSSTGSSSVTLLSGSQGRMPASPIIGLAKDEVVYQSLPLGSNLIRNAGAEEGTASSTGAGATELPGWVAASTFSIASYGYIYPATESTRINGGNNFFFGGVNATSALATQDIDATCLATQIDTGTLTAKLSGYIGGRDGERDTAAVKVTFYSETDARLGILQIGPQAGTNDVWNYLENSMTVPTKTRYIRVQMVGTRIIGKNCDAFFDNLSLILQ